MYRSCPFIILSEQEGHQQSRKAVLGDGEVGEEGGEETVILVLSSEEKVAISF